MTGPIESTQSTPRALSIAIATTQPWPEVRGTLDSVFAQADGLRAEVVLAVRSPRCAPPALAYPGLHILEGPDETVFQLRARAIAATSGAIVATTEDHCRVAPDWCRRILEAHAEYPDADIIGGAVANGACDALGWAAFLISNGPFLPPLETREQAIVTGQANVSFKRRALPGLAAGELDEGHRRVALQQRGGRLMTDGRILVVHDQHLAPRLWYAIEFHGGRALAGSQREHLTPGRWLLRLAKVLLSPVRVLVNPPRVALRAARTAPEYRRPLLRCQAWLALLYAFYYAGELTGHLAGPGASPHHLR